MEFHISRAIREKLAVDGLLFSYTGNVVFANVAASRKLANQLNELRNAEADPSRVVNAGALFAMGMIDELKHAFVARYRREIDPAVLSEALKWFAAKIGPEQVDRLLLNFVELFPGVDVFQGRLTAQQWLAGASGEPEGMSNREAALEELLLLWITNINPAFAPFQELFDDKSLQAKTQYKSVTAGLPDYLSTRPPVDSEVGSLFQALQAPMLASPDSITGQLEFIRENWQKYLGEDLNRVLLAIDVLKEEDVAIWMRFHPPGPDKFGHAAPTWGTQGFIGDEFVGFDELGEFEVGADGVRRRRYAEGYQAPLVEYEAFSADQAWMPNVVLIAKSTYVWLEQLSKKYGRHIHHLDHIPDEELELMASRGVTGLWLIGLWERSIASRTIKRLRGHGDAVASAYSLKEYNIAEDLGGGYAYSNLRDRAARFGLRLASDMVPNHMGIDSPWVIDHPDWFISKPDSPYPVYSFNGPDISPDSRVEIKIEDHYYDQTDAAVVFRLRHFGGQTRYVYHGNDGTSFAWNDTAQLDYSKAYVREHVMQTILHVARQFPIIRFDAAMVLAKRHVQRLWFPLPGAGGSIPSRAEDAISQEAFDALMPLEFWREVVDRVAVEVPGTLLLAEAFWLLEGYFVRTLGMHRVYNSAFMNMLRDEENAKYRSYLKKTIEFDPDILKRYVNFMSNPDERTAIDQFGWGDKYFGVCTMLSTLPGLPMFGHGQIEGFTERYGMEYKTAKMDESENEGLIARHRHDIAPLLKSRWLFAESTNFVLYDFWNDHGTVDENVFAYSNRMHGQRALIFYNNRYGSTHGSIHHSVGFMDKASGNLRQTSLADGLGLPADYELILAYRDNASGLEYLRRSTDLHHNGIGLELRGYQTVVLLHWRELYSSAEYPWGQLCDDLGGRGVHSVDEALVKLKLGPIHDALRQAVSKANVYRFAEVSGEPEKAAKPAAKAVAEPVNPVATPAELAVKAPLPQVDPRIEKFLERCQFCSEKILANLPGDLAEALHGQAIPETDPKQSLQDAALGALQLPHLERKFSTAWPPAVRYTLPSHEPGVPMEQTWAPALAWILLNSLPTPGIRADLFDKLHLRSALAETFSSMGVDGERIWRAAASIRLLLAMEDDPSLVFDSDEFWQSPDVRWLAGVNESEGVLYLHKERFEELLSWLQLPALLQIAQQTGAAQARSIRELEGVVTRASKSAKEAGYKLEKYLKLGRPGLSAQASAEKAKPEEPAADPEPILREP